MARVPSVRLCAVTSDGFQVPATRQQPYASRLLDRELTPNGMVCIFSKSPLEVKSRERAPPSQIAAPTRLLSGWRGQPPLLLLVRHSPALRDDGGWRREDRGENSPKSNPSRFEPMNLQHAEVFSLSSSGGEGRGEEAVYA